MNSIKYIIIIVDSRSKPTRGLTGATVNESSPKWT